MSNQRDAIRARIYNGLAKACPRAVNIQGDTSIVRDLQLDSLAVMDFILALEDDFDISMPLEKVAEVETVDDLINTVESLMVEREA